MGRPPSITLSDYEEVETLAGYGLTIPQIADILGVSERTIHNYKGNDEAFAAAFERGKAVAASQVAKALFHKALDGDVTAIKWWEMTRAGRSEKTSHQVNVETGVMRVPEPESPDDWERRLNPATPPNPNRENGKSNV